MFATAARWMLLHELRLIRSWVRNARWRVELWRRFWGSYRRYLELAPAAERPALADLSPQVEDATATTPVEPIYFFQDAWAFEKIHARAPARHVDVGSHHKLVAFLSKVVPTTMVDLRPLPVDMPSIGFVEGSILALPFADGSLPSVSSICVVEHIGLGRYGDPLDPDGTRKAIAELKRVIAPGGDLYVSLPLDDVDRVYFNAHRAFAEPTALALFAPFDVLERRYIYGYEFLEQPRPGFGVGCYHLRRPAES